MKELEEFVIWHFANAELDENRLELRVGGELVDLEARPMELLLLLLRNAGKTVTTQEISDEVWPERRGHISEKVISNNVHKARTALGDVNYTIIQTQPRKGYRLLAEVTRRTIHKPAPEFVELEVGQQVRNRPQWTLVRRLAAGGYGEAWLAQHAGTGEQHVFKFSFRVQQSSALKREVTISRLLQKALPERTEFVPVIDWDFEQVPYFIESEFSGINPREWSDAAGGLDRVPLSTRLALITSIADAIGAAHAVGVLHLDLKPENILVEEEDAGPSARICDFGAGRLIDRSALDQLKLTALGLSRTAAADSTTGTAAYIAPEVYAGGVRTERCDVYSLGVLLYQFVIGDLSRPIATGWEAHIDDVALRDDIAQCTQGDPGRRLASAQLLANRLQNLDARRRQLEADKRAREEADKNALSLQRIKARRPALIAAMAILLVGIGITSYLYWKQKEETARANSYMEFFLDDVPTAILPPQANGKDTKYLNALVVSLPLASKRFEKDSWAEMELISQLLDAAGVLNDPDDQLVLLKRQYDLYLKAFGADSKYVLTTQFVMIDTLYRIGQTKDAVAMLKAIEGRAKDLIGDTVVHARWIDLQTRVASFEGRTGDAVQWRKEKLALYRKFSTDKVAFSPDYLYRTYSQLVADLVNDHQYSQAIELGEQSLPLLKANLGVDAAYTQMLEASLAEAYARSSPNESTEKTLLAECEKVAKNLGQSTLDAHDCWNHFAGFLEDSGRWADAADIRKVAWDRESVDGRCNRTNSCIEIRMAYALDEIQLGQIQTALQVVQSALDDSDSNLTAEDRTRAMGLYVRALALVAAGDESRAASSIAALRNIITGYSADTTLWQGRLLLVQAGIQSMSGDLHAGTQAAMQAIESLKEALGEHSAEAVLAEKIVQKNARQ